MKNNDDIPTTDTNEIKQLTNRVKRGELDQGDALLIEKLLRLSEDDPEFWIVWREFSAKPRSVF